MSIPSLLLAAMIAATLKQPIIQWARAVYEQTRWPFLANTTWLDLVIVFGGLSFVSWPAYCRLIRGQILSLREKEYVEAARSVGVTGRGIALRYLLPNGLGPIIVHMTFSLGSAMVLESSLSFLGIGVMPPQASWGNMIQSNIGSWSYRPWLVAVPAATLAIVTLGINFLGDGLNDALNPRSSKAI
jgi:ABC-type dipeptide/oligopeptide/nickel transport system permease subunit